MKRVAKSLLLVALVLTVAVPLSAEEKKKEKKKGKGRPSAAAFFLKRVAKAELTEEQVAKVKETAAGFQEKLAAARKKAGLSQEQRQARAEALKKAKADGLKGKAAREAVEKATQLTDDQKAALAEAQGIQKELNAALLGLLTDEQKEKAGLGKKKGAKKPGKKPAKKPAAKKADAKKADN